jgi:putative RNA 2'-phosphotransferase
MKTDKPMKNMIQTSKFLSMVLRHKPEVIHVNMDNNGRVDIDELINNANKCKNMQLTKETIMEVVQKNDKRRFIVDNEKNDSPRPEGRGIRPGFE